MPKNVWEQRMFVIFCYVLSSFFCLSLSAILIWFIEFTSSNEWLNWVGTKKENVWLQSKNALEMEISICFYDLLPHKMGSLLLFECSLDTGAVKKIHQLFNMASITESCLDGNNANRISTSLTSDCICQLSRFTKCRLSSIVQLIDWFTSPYDIEQAQAQFMEMHHVYYFSRRFDKNDSVLHFQWKFNVIKFVFHFLSLQCNKMNFMYVCLW